MSALLVEIYFFKLLNGPRYFHKISIEVNNYFELKKTIIFDN